MAEDHENSKTLAGLWLKSKPSRKSPSTPTSAIDSGNTDSQMGLLFSSPPSASKSSPELIARPVSPAERRIWSVRDLVTGIRQQVEQEYQDIWVEGEITNCRPAPSGHIYFSLKDQEAQLPVVLFRREAQLLRFRPQDGLAVLVRGRISVYESRGQLQLIAETIEPRGAGALRLAFEQLKARLLAEGLFDTARKRPLPAFPRCIGVITSTGGAVLHDIIKVSRRRHARLNLLVYPAMVQGPGCADSVAAGIRWFNKRQPNKPQPNQPQPSKRRTKQPIPKVDLILIARGGGSMEDLAGFNDESLARAIAASALPVVAAIGHETDFTIADFVADLRAPTPSAAAELITEAQHRIEERVQALDSRAHRAIRYQIILAHQRFAAFSTIQIHNRVQALIGRRAQRLDDLSRRFESVANRILRTRSAVVAALTARIQRLNPAVRLGIASRRLDTAEQSLNRFALAIATSRRAQLSQASARLHALSPLAVLSRGYALVHGPDGRLIRSAADTQPGQIVSARLATGSLTARVETVEPE
jgi:exodeoxyribonuclease VII large subunit